MTLLTLTYTKAVSRGRFGAGRVASTVEQGQLRASAKSSLIALTGRLGYWVSCALAVRGSEMRPFVAFGGDFASSWWFIPSRLPRKAT